MQAVRVVSSVLVLIVCGALAASAAAAPIVDTGTPSLPPFQGAPATKHKIKDPTIARQNPFMARTRTPTSTTTPG